MDQVTIDRKKLAQVYARLEIATDRLGTMAGDINIDDEDAKLMDTICWKQKKCLRQMEAWINQGIVAPMEGTPHE
jgi:hypothetical protein